MDLKRYVLMWSSICRNMQNLQMKIINLSLGPLQRMPREKSMLYSVTFSSINAQFCNIAFSQMVYCPNWCSYYIPFHLTFIRKLSFSQWMKVGLSYLSIFLLSAQEFTSLSSHPRSRSILLRLSVTLAVTCRYSAVLLKSEIMKRK